MDETNQEKEESRDDSRDDSFMRISSMYGHAEHEEGDVYTLTYAML